VTESGVAFRGLDDLVDEGEGGFSGELSQVSEARPGAPASSPTAILDLSSQKKICVQDAPSFPILD